MTIYILISDVNSREMSIEQIDMRILWLCRMNVIWPCTVDLSGVCNTTVSFNSRTTYFHLRYQYTWNDDSRAFCSEILSTVWYGNLPWKSTIYPPSDMKIYHENLRCIHRLIWKSTMKIYDEILSTVWYEHLRCLIWKSTMSIHVKWLYISIYEINSREMTVVAHSFLNYCLGYQIYNRVLTVTSYPVFHILSTL